MALATYISDLLYRYECVIVPGFGAFITQYHSASLNPMMDGFHPPFKSVSFNSQLTQNDGLLANHIAEVEQISYTTAVEKLGTFVQDLNDLLEKNQQVTLPKIGSFKLSAEEKLQFQPETNTNYLKEAFGLSAVTAAQVAREVYTQPVVTLEEKAPIAFTPERRASRPYLRYAAIGLLAIGISGYTGLNIYSNQITEHNIAEQQEAAFQIESQIQEATFVINNPLPAVTLKVSKQSGNYHIVAGAFRMEENAEIKVQELKQQGFKARKLEPNKFGLHQVIYSSHEKRRDAINTLRKIKNSTNQGAWLLVEELD